MIIKPLFARRKFMQATHAHKAVAGAKRRLYDTILMR